MFHQPATENGTQGGGDCRETRPRTNRPTTAFFIERCTDDRQAARHKECSPYTLNTSRDDQLMNVRGKATTDGGHSERRYTQHEYQAAAEQVAQRATNQNQRSQE